MHSDRWEPSCLWLSSLPELVRVLYQAHHSTTPSQVLFSCAIDVSNWVRDQDLCGTIRHQNLAEPRDLREPPRCHPFRSVSFFLLRRVRLSLHLSQSPRLPWVFVLTAAILRSLSSTVSYSTQFQPKAPSLTLCRTTLLREPESIHDHAALVL